MTTDYSVLNDQLATMAFITQHTGLTDKWFYKLILLGEFPKPIKLGRNSRWLQSEVEACPFCYRQLRSVATTFR
ncbi:AlpA family phage regulatory protein [Enterobacter asburiae]|nr:AlpA family phage regulatory protein [Enterobacter asburiae]